MSVSMFDLFELLKSSEKLNSTFQTIKLPKHTNKIIACDAFRQKPSACDDPWHGVLPIPCGRSSSSYERGSRACWHACDGMVDKSFSLYIAFIAHLALLKSGANVRVSLETTKSLA